MLKVTASYLEKQKSFIPIEKKIFFGHNQYQNKKALFTDWIFREGFAPGYDAGGAGSVRDGNLFKGKFIHLKRCINGIFTRFLSQPLSFVLAHEMVFCFQNCSSDREIFLRSLQQWKWTVKGQNNFW